MEEKRNYEILKFVMHGDKCYMSTDIVKGKPLIVWLKYHGHITKEQFYEWARQIIADLDHFHRCRGNPCYQYVNPYSVIVGEDRKERAGRHDASYAAALCEGKFSVAREPVLSEVRREGRYLRFWQDDTVCFIVS